MLPIDSVGIAIPGVYPDWSAGYFHRKVEFVEFNAVLFSGDYFFCVKGRKRRLRTRRLFLALTSLLGDGEFEEVDERSFAGCCCELCASVCIGWAGGTTNADAERTDFEWAGGSEGG